MIWYTKWWRPNPDILPAFALMELGKSQETSLRIDYVAVGVRTQYLPNMCQGRYSYANPFINGVKKVR
jgi:hypothetical protein